MADHGLTIIPGVLHAPAAHRGYGMFVDVIERSSRSLEAMTTPTG
jgi:hypothetical protein